MELVAPSWWGQVMFTHVHTAWKKHSHPDRQLAPEGWGREGVDHSAIKHKSASSFNENPPFLPTEVARPWLLFALQLHHHRGVLSEWKAIHKHLLIHTILLNTQLNTSDQLNTSQTTPYIPTKIEMYPIFKRPKEQNSTYFILIQSKSLDWKIKVTKFNHTSGRVRPWEN